MWIKSKNLEVRGEMDYYDGQKDVAIVSNFRTFMRKYIAYPSIFRYTVTIQTMLIEEVVLWLDHITNSGNYWWIKR